MELLCIYPDFISVKFTGVCPVFCPPEDRKKYSKRPPILLK
jgi:hypothetical protein